MEKTHIIVTGATGFVGSRFVQTYKDHYVLYTPTHAEMDITDEQSVRHYVAQHPCPIILHLAAISNTWHCQQHPEESYAVNVQGVLHLAKAAEDVGARLIFFSSDQIYNGNCQHGLLGEDVAVAPENIYGQHKLEAEQQALSVCPDTVALRATWMYDAPTPNLPIHPNFLTTLSTCIRERKPITLSPREYRGITPVLQVVNLLPHTFQLPAGIYNFGAENTLNTYDTAKSYLIHLGIPHAEELLLTDTQRFLDHERNLSISMKKAEQASQGKIHFSNTLEGLKDFDEMMLTIR